LSSLRAVASNRPEKHDHLVQICVGNNGPGIPPERVPHVFERFYRARGDEQTPGHGLGLSIARELARAHGGDLTLGHVARGLDRIPFAAVRVERSPSDGKTASGYSKGSGDGF